MIMTLTMIIILGVIAINLTTLVLADTQIQLLNTGTRHAFYAAQSGIEYGVRYALEYAANNSSMSGLDNYEEVLDTGNGTSCTVTIDVGYDADISIVAVGLSQNSVKTIQKTINYINVADYAIYTSGTVRNMRTIPSNGVTLENASIMPKFDLDVLRDEARPSQYFSGNLNLNYPFTFSRSISFVEQNLTFGRFNWANVGSFVVRGDVLIETSYLPLGFTDGVIYQPETGTTFQSEWQLLWRELEGGVISNGDLNGTNRTNLPFRFTIRYNRSRINDLMRYSVNGGPLVITGSQWTIVQ